MKENIQNSTFGQSN